jgi:ABC-type antimicrobial peptide transport system permease subunit
VINETLARRLWPGEDAIGKLLRLGEDADEVAEVIGIASDGKYATLGERPTSYLYQPLLQNHSADMTLVVRTGSDPQHLIAAVRKQIQSLDQNLPVGPIKTLREQVDSALFTARLGAALPGVFGLLALGLATIGIYGVIAYSVNQRTQEFGIRLALGASSLKLQQLVLREGLTVVLIGVVIGLSLSLAVTRLLAGLLYGISPTDPLTFIGVSLLLTAVAALACYLPARRVAKVDPAVALRQE